MASVLNQLPNSTLSLQGNGFNPRPQSSDWGYVDSSRSTNPEDSRLHFEPVDMAGYSVDNTPNVIIKDYNRVALGGSTAVKPPSTLDELDPNAPSNTMAGMAGSVVSQVYKSPNRLQYKTLGPQPGRY